MRHTLHRLVLAVVTTGLLSACADSERGQVAEETVLPTAVGESQSGHLTEIIERGALRVGTTGDYYLSALDPATGKRTGFDIELTTRLAADIGVEIEYVSTDWSSLLSGLSSGRYDMTTSASYTVGRARLAAYSIPVLETGLVALVRMDDLEHLSDWDAINAPRVHVVVERGGTVDEYAREIVPDARVRAVDTLAVAVLEVEEGRADVVLARAVDAASRLAAGTSLQPSAAGPARGNYMGMLVRHGDDELRAYLDSWIRAQQYSGYLDALIYEHHLAF